MAERIGALTRRLDGPGDPVDSGAMMRLLRLLHDVGREDLPLGRLFEGHVDAVQIVMRYAREEQRARVAEMVARGATLGVWNADLPGEALTLADGRLSGGKSFASGAGLLSHALVTVDAEGGRQLILLDLARTPPVVDRSVWQVAGMQRSESHVVRWESAEVAPDDLIGVAGDYVREPWFAGGALRFAAVQAGGIAAVVEGARDHLVTAGRAGDPHQAARLASMYALAQAANAAVRAAGEGWFDDPDAHLPLVAAARTAVYGAGTQVIALAQEAVGVQAQFTTHPLAARIADLSTYLRQPAPDAQRMQVGAAVAAGTLRVDL